eukprot:gene23961-9533_t
MDISTAISTGATFAQWIKDASKELEVMRTSNLHLSSAERDQRAQRFILDQLSHDLQAVYHHFNNPDNIMSSLKDEYSSFYFSTVPDCTVSDPDTDLLPYPFLEYPSSHARSVSTQAPNANTASTSPNLPPCFDPSCCCCCGLCVLCTAGRRKKERKSTASRSVLLRRSFKGAGRCLATAVGLNSMAPGFASATLLG